MEFLRSISSKLLGSRPTDDTPEECPFNVKEVSESVFDLYNPGEDANVNVEVVFFHGLQLGDHSNSYWSTWRTADNQLWPQAWLPEAFPNARILSISYDKTLNTRSEEEVLDLHTIGSHLIQSLIGEADVGQKRNCPVVLVGHSFGGLVIKQLCVQAEQELASGTSMHEEKLRLFLTNVKGCFFYATPHRGVAFEMAESFAKGPLLEYVKLLSTYAARLQEDFRHVCKLYGNWQIAALGESFETVTRRRTGVVVPEASARDGSFCMVAADHISICKPKDKVSNSFQHLKRLIGDILSKYGEAIWVDGVSNARVKTEKADGLTKNQMLDRYGKIMKFGKATNSPLITYARA